MEEGHHRATAAGHPVATGQTPDNAVMRRAISPADPAVLPAAARAAIEERAAVEQPAAVGIGDAFNDYSCNNKQIEPTRLYLFVPTNFIVYPNIIQSKKPFHETVNNRYPGPEKDRRRQ
jgi:hypothetical protein